MEEQIQSADSPAKPEEGLGRMAYVLLVVLIICGGNGIGIITGALVWKFTGAVGIAIALAIGITAAAFAGAMLLIRSHHRKNN